MSTKVPTQRQSIEAEDRFVPVGAPTPMTSRKLTKAHDVHADVAAHQEAVFAVAHQQGIVQRDADEYEREAMNVLYMTADGERACERWYLGAGPEDFAEVDRAFPADVSDLQPAGECARRFAPITRRHPEVRD